MQSLPASQDKAVVVEGTAWRLLDDQRATHISAPPQEWKHAAKQRFLPNTQILKKHKEKLEKQISDLHFTDHRFFFLLFLFCKQYEQWQRTKKTTQQNRHHTMMKKWTFPFCSKQTSAARDKPELLLKLIPRPGSPTLPALGTRLPSPGTQAHGISHMGSVSRSWNVLRTPHATSY